MKRLGLPLNLLLGAGALFLAACNGEEGSRVRRADETSLPESDLELLSLPAGTTVAELVKVVDLGLETQGKGPDATRFVVIRDQERHPPEVKDNQFHVVVGAGRRYPKGSLRIRRRWIASGRIDGNNEQLQTLGLSLAIERGAPRPYEPEVIRAVGDFCEALAARLPIHPDCVVAMGEVPYTNPHPADADERALAAEVRKRVPVPDTDGAATIVTAKGRIEVTYEKRDTGNGILVGMMMRKRFDGKKRGMLFLYPWRDYRRFWMRNCFVPIDVAYIRDGKIEQIHTMRPEAGTPNAEIPFYPSAAAVKYALEMPGGWFAGNGVQKGDAVRMR